MAKVIKGKDGNGGEYRIKAYAVERKARKKAEALEFGSKPIDDRARQVLGKNTGVMEPPFNPHWLATLVHHNNTLAQCISAMEVNIDGSGFVIEPKSSTMKRLQSLEDGPERDNLQKELDDEIEGASQFFKEVSPNMSFTTVRRKLRRDLESIGYGFLEVLRNATGDIVALKHVDAKTMWLVRLGDPVMVTHKFIRFGKEQTVNMRVRERKFVQLVGSAVVYFKEFGASRDIDRETGKFSGEKDEKSDSVVVTVDPSKKGTEIIFFTLEEDGNSPYGLPRWINNLPSVLGSRKAEEENLEFFDAGGVPPVIITLMGGKFVSDVNKQLQAFLNSKNTTKNRVVVLEAESAEGSFEGTAPNFKMDVQRFGSEKQKDSLYEVYDEKSSERIRSSFRIPPLFLGKVKDFNFATAFTAYLIAESQVFQPEREEFDESVNNKLIRGLDFKHVQFKSLPINLDDVKVQLEALSKAFDTGGMTLDQFFEQLNTLSGMKLRLDVEEEDVEDEGEVDDQSDEGVSDDQEGDQQGESGNGQPDDTGGNSRRTPSNPIQRSVKKSDLRDLLDLTDDLLAVVSGEEEYSDIFKSTVYQQYNSLADKEQDFVSALVASKLYGNIDVDKDGIREIVHNCIGVVEGIDSCEN